MTYQRKPTRITRAKPRTRAVGRSVQPGRYDSAWSSRAGSPKKHQTPPPYAALSEVPADLLLRASEKLLWIGEFCERGCPRGELLPCARRYAEFARLPEAAIPPYTTLNTWVHRYQAFGLLGLVDGVRKDKGTPRTMSPDAVELLKTALEGGVRGYAALKDLLASKAPLTEEQLAKRAARGEPAEAVATRYHVVRRVARDFEARNPHVIAMARHGPLWFRNHFRLAMQHGVFPGGYRLSIDSTVADIWVRIRDLDLPEGWRPVRPVLTLIEDVGTRLYVTHNLSVRYAVDSGICLGTLQRAVDPGHNFPVLPSTGVPREMSLDKGSEHQGAFRRALDRLGIRVAPRQDNDPQGGARIERLIETVSLEVFSREVGYSKAEKVFDPYAPPDKDAKRTLTQLRYDPYRLEVPVTALLTVRQLEEKLLAWATLYNERPHDGLPEDCAETQRTIAVAAERARAIRLGPTLDMQGAIHTQEVA